MKKVLLCAVFVISFFAVVEFRAYADDCDFRMNEDWCGPGPFGGYPRGPGWGWYGARRPVQTVNDAKAILHEYYAKDRVRIGKIMERKGYFQAEVRDENGKVVDVVIVDKASGRIRSIQQ